VNQEHEKLGRGHKKKAGKPHVKKVMQTNSDQSSETFLSHWSDNSNHLYPLRAYPEKGTAYIRRLMIKPDSQNKGIGTRLMQAIEEHFRMADRYELFTGHRSARNLYL
jgi:GNAT superfamily N-acetyltransferase